MEFTIIEGIHPPKMQNTYISFSVDHNELIIYCPSITHTKNRTKEGCDKERVGRNVERVNIKTNENDRMCGVGSRLVARSPCHGSP